MIRLIVTTTLSLLALPVWAQVIDLTSSTPPSMAQMMALMDAGSISTTQVAGLVPGTTLGTYMAITGSNSGAIVTLKVGDPYVVGNRLPDTSLLREREVLNRINTLRLQFKYKPFIYDPQLSVVARNYAKRMRQEKRFSHTDPQKKNARHRIQQGKYATKLSRWGEVIAQSTTSKEAFDTFMSSPRHKAILLTTGSTGYNLIGIGNRKGNTVGLLFYNPHTKLKRITFDIPRAENPKVVPSKSTSVISSAVAF